MRSRFRWLPLIALCAWATHPLYASPPPPPRSAAAPGPNAFGTVALALGPNRYSARWQRVAKADRSPGIARIVSPALQMGRSGQARFVNAALNRRIEFRPDKGDRWSPASETLSRSAGDCEDYAIAKLHALRALGVPDQDMFLTLGRDNAVRQAHAVLLIRLAGQYWVMDNRTDRLIPHEQFRDFVPIISLRADGKSWLHGYARGGASTARKAGPTHE